MLIKIVAPLPLLVCVHVTNKKGAENSHLCVASANIRS